MQTTGGSQSALAGKIGHFFTMRRDSTWELVRNLTQLVLTSNQRDPIL